MDQLEQAEKTDWTTFAFGLGTIAVGFVGAPLVFVGLVLLFGSETSAGRAFGTGIIFLAFAIQPFSWRGRKVFGLSCALSALLCLGSVVVARSKLEHDLPSAVRVEGGAAPSGASPFRLLPELDQALVFSRLVDWFAEPGANDPIATRETLVELYADSAAPLAAAPSLLEDAFTDSCSGRAFVWPANTINAPTLLAVHAYGGSSSAYLRVLRPVAISLGAGIVQPSCGLGRWETEAELRTFDAYAGVQRTGATHLIAVANGGLAVSRRMASVIANAASLVLVSPEFDLEAMAASERSERRIPALVLVGESDERVPREHIDAGMTRLERLGFDAELVVMEGAGHDAFFREREKIRSALLTFYAAQTERRRR